MSIAFTGPLLYTTSILAGSNAQFRASLHTLFSTLLPFTPITNGYVYDLASPQGLTAKLRVRDPMVSGQPDLIGLQMTGSSGSPAGIEHYLRAAASRVYQAQFCPCQLLLSVPSSAFAGDNALGLGIPFIPNLSPPSGCAPSLGPGSTVTDAWWSWVFRAGNKRPKTPVASSFANSWSRMAMYRARKSASSKL